MFFQVPTEHVQNRLHCPDRTCSTLHTHTHTRTKEGKERKENASATAATPSINSGRSRQVAACRRDYTPRHFGRTTRAENVKVRDRWNFLRGDVIRPTCAVGAFCFFPYFSFLEATFRLAHRVRSACAWAPPSHLLVRTRRSWCVRRWSH